MCLRTQTNVVICFILCQCIIGVNELDKQVRVLSLGSFISGLTMAKKEEFLDKSVEFIGIRVPSDMKLELEKKAMEDERSLSAYIKTLFSKAIKVKKK